MLLFLKNTVPKEARTVEQELTQFNAALNFVGLEEYMTQTTGLALALTCPDSAAIAQEWRDVAKRYRSMLPADGHQV